MHEILISCGFSAPAAQTVVPTEFGKKKPFFLIINRKDNNRYSDSVK